MESPILLWRWLLTDEVSGKRRKTRYLMSEADARARHGDDAVKDGTGREERYPSGGAAGTMFRPSEARER